MLEVPTELAELLDSWQFDASGYFDVHSCTWTPAEFRAVFSADDGEGAFETLFYELTASACTGQLEVNRGMSDFAVSNEHILLLDYNEPRGRLMFKGPPANPDFIAAKIVSHHREAYGAYIEENHWLNGGEEDLRRHLKHPAGQLAKGPICVLEGYAKIAGEYGLPTYWSGEQTTPPDKRYQLVEFANGWLIASDFNMRRMTRSDLR